MLVEEISKNNWCGIFSPGLIIDDTVKKRCASQQMDCKRKLGYPRASKRAKTMLITQGKSVPSNDDGGGRMCFVTHS